MLINLSNHPFEKWDNAHQQAAINEFGVVEDFSFPDVDPMATTEEIKKIASAYFDECMEMLKTSYGKSDAIHISGEPCFLFQFVTRAKAQGIPCVCSTTRRLVTNNGNTKTSVFQFVQFRKY